MKYFLDDGAPSCDQARLMDNSGAVLRLRGGGGDGGSTGAESRDAYLEMYLEKKPDKVDPKVEAAARWRVCHYSGEELEQPVMVDDLGNLFNKGAILEGMLGGQLPPHLAHITKMKHLIQARLEENPQYDQSGNGALGSKDARPDNQARFQCPITGLPMNGAFKFVIFRETGLAVSEKALRDAPQAVDDILGKPAKQSPTIPINPPQDVAIELKVKLLQERQAEAKLKKDKKKSKKSKADGEEESLGVGGGVVKPHTKKGFVAAQHMPKGANAKVYASLFHSSNPQAMQETYLCRNVSARRMG